MDIMIFALAVTIFIGNSCSQMLSTSPPCYSNGDTLTLHCETADFTQTITFLLNTVDQGGCIPGLGCAPGITQSVRTTSMTISSFSNSAHNGSWTCSYGTSTSAALIINENPCQEDDIGGGLSDGEKAGIGTGVPAGCATVGGGVAAVIIIIMKIGTVIIVYVEKGHDITIGETLNTSGVQWTKDGKKVESNRVVGNRCKVQSASEDDEGLYVCTLGKDTKKYRLIVLEEIIYIDKSLDTECSLGPGQNCTTDAVWKKDGRVVKSTHSLGTKFFISTPSAKDDGLYVCILKSIKKQFKYYVIVVGTEETVYAYQGFQAEFGKTIPIENTQASARWTKNREKVESHHSERTKFGIDKTCVKDEGLYICTFGSNNMTLKYNLIVVGTEEIVYGYQGHQKEFGKTIPDENTIKNAQWTKDNKKVESHHSERTKFGIDKTCGEDEGSYVCTFGPNNMKLTYHLIVVGTVESFSVNEGDAIKFGKDIPNKLALTNGRWTKDDKEIKSNNIKGTVIEIKNAVKKESGLYVLTFGPNNMKCQYKLTVLRTEEIVYASQGLPIEFGKTIPDKKTTENAQWTKSKKTVGSDHSERTKFRINNTCEKDEGLYICTFGPKNIKLKYYLIVVGTVESFSVNEGNATKFGKDIPIKFAPTNARWTKDDKKIESDNIKGTVIKISNPEEKDGGLYVLTFAPDNMKCQYKLTVLKSEDGNETVRKLRKKEEKLENGAADQVIPATVKTVDETKERLPHSGKLTPVEK